MTTVTAKKLRNNLSHYLDQLENGEEVVIIRHSEIIGSLKPVALEKTPNGRAVADMLERNKSFFKANAALSPESTNIKDLYHKTLEKKHSV